MRWRLPRPNPLVIEWMTTIHAAAISLRLQRFGIEGEMSFSSLSDNSRLWPFRVKGDNIFSVNQKIWILTFCSPWSNCPAGPGHVNVDSGDKSWPQGRDHRGDLWSYQLPLKMTASIDGLIEGSFKPSGTSTYQQTLEDDFAATLPVSWPISRVGVKVVETRLPLHGWRLNVRCSSVTRREVMGVVTSSCVMTSQ